MFPLAVEIPTELLASIGTMLGALLAGAAKVYSDHRDLKKKHEGQGRDHGTILENRDKRIVDLTSALEKKSEEHAEKVEQLCEVTLIEVKAMGEKNVDLVERMLKGFGDLTGELRALKGAILDLNRRAP